jgi:hypothetical protein
VCVDRFLKSIRPAERFTQIRIKCRNPRLDRDCLADQLRPFVAATTLMQQQTKQVQGVGVARLLREDLAVPRLSLVELAFAMAIQRGVQVGLSTHATILYGGASI